MAPEILYALCGVVAFTSASFLFRAVTHRTSPLWMNAFKASSAALAFFIWASVEGMLKGWPSPPVLAVALFLVSGLLGLNISDWFMLRSYARIGPARTMIVYRFQPLYLGAMAYFFLGQTLSPSQLFAVLLLIGCVVVLSHEGKRNHGKWDVAGVGIAFTGMMLDGTGVLISRVGFDLVPGLGTAQANVIRCGGALLGFLAISLWKRPKGLALRETFIQLGSKYQFMAVFGSIFGTFLGLFLWLKALSMGNVAQISAMGGLAPVIAILIESALSRKWPGGHALVALVLCLCGMALLIS